MKIEVWREKPDRRSGNVDLPTPPYVGERLLGALGGEVFKVDRHPETGAIRAWVR